jgi:mRNA interferase RelE/StbE
VSYEIVFKRKVRKAVALLPANVYGRVSRAIDDLADNPRPRGARRMRGTGEEDWRLRIGDYRVIYRIEEPHPQGVERDRDGLVTVLAVGHRQSVYG